jgi:ribosomal protein S3
MFLLTQEMRNWKEEAKVTTPIMYRHSICGKEVIVCTSQPGWLIGKAGRLVNKYSEIISNILREPTAIKFVEVGYDVI